MDLEGITVVALEQAVAAPYASSRLADAGARSAQRRHPRRIRWVKGSIDG